MDKVRDSYTPLSEPLRVYLHVYDYSSWRLKYYLGLILAEFHIETIPTESAITAKESYDRFVKEYAVA
jgi:hypothetical protein